MAIELPDGRCESDDVLEALRLRAVHARGLGYAVGDIAAILGVREEAVSRRCSRYDRGGRAALPGDRTGRPIGSGRLLDGQQEQSVQRTIETRCPQELAIPSALWTRQAVRELIHQRAGIRLPTRTVGEYLRRWGFTPQKPVRRASKQDPKAVAEWLAANRQRIAQFRRVVLRYLTDTTNGRGNRQRSRAWVSVSRSATCRASASGRARSGTPSAARARCPPPSAGTGPDASCPRETIGSTP